jgi:hypothetical protein
MKKSLAKIKELPAPYDLKKMVKDCKAEGYATEYGIAWTEGRRLQHRAQKQDKLVSGIPASAFVRCILITKGAKWIISNRAEVLHRLNGNKTLTPNPNAPEILPITFPAWLEERRTKLNALSQSACENDIFFADLWREKGEEIKAGEIKEIMVENPIHSHLLVSFTLGSESLNELELMMEYAERKDAKLQSHEGDAFFFRAIKLGYEVGLRIQQLEAEVTNFQSMKMASQTSAGKKQSQRTKWLAALINKLDKNFGRNARRAEIIAHIEGKIDPESGKPICIAPRYTDEDYMDESAAEKVIHWGIGEPMTFKDFGDKIYDIRKMQKKCIGI